MAELCWRLVERGDLLLLLQGVPGDMDAFAPVADALAHDTKAITISLRYSGDGQHGARALGTEQQRDDLIDVIGETGGPVSIVAWSQAAPNGYLRSFRGFRRIDMMKASRCLPSTNTKSRRRPSISNPFDR